MRNLSYLYIIALCAFHATLILFSYYAPDAYVFVKYAFEDNIERTVDLISIINNNFLFDILVVIGDILCFTTSTDWLIFITSIYAIIFLIKYLTLVNNGKTSDVTLVYIASFFTDLNQLRFNLALLLLFSLIYQKNIIFKFATVVLAFFSHIVPTSFFLLTKAKKFIIPGSIAIIYILWSDLQESRLLSYTEATEFYFPKSLLLALPVTYYLFTEKRKNIISESFKNFCIPIYIAAILITYINVEMASRFFELTFIVATISNVFVRFKTITRVIFFFFAISSLISRVFFGISNSTNFIDLYKLTV